LRLFENKDCMEGMKEYPDNYFDLAIVDPPYGINFKYNTYEDTEENLKLIIKYIFPEIIRVSKRAVFFGSHQKIFLYPQPDWIVAYTWNTTGSYGKLGVCQWQPILFYGDDIKGFGSVNGLIKSDLIPISGGDGVGFRRMERIEHPCPKPINIIKLILRRFANDGDLILDPMSGSGTTFIACEDLGFDYVGFEIDKKYYDESKERIKKYRSQLNLFKPARKQAQENKQNALFEKD